MVFSMFSEKKTKQSGCLQDSADFFEAIPIQMKKDVTYVASIPLSVDNFLKFIGDLNLLRLQLVFSRITAQAILNAARQANLLKRLESLLKTHVNIIRLNALNGMFNVLSIGIYAIRFFVVITQAIQKAIQKTEKNQSWTQLFINVGDELKASHPIILNDLVWGIVNSLTNFAVLFRITSPIANSLLAVFLCFDIWLLTYRLSLAKNEYEKDKLFYQNRIEALEQGYEKKELLYQNNTASLKENILIAQHIEDKNEKIQELWAIEAVLNQINSEKKQEVWALKAVLSQKDLEWQAESAFFWFNIGGAALLGTGFLLTLILTFPGSLPLAFCVCTLGIAMYATGEVYKKYKLASLYYTDKNYAENILQRTIEETEQARQEMIQARNEFIFSYVKNVVMPLLIMTTFAFNWPAGIVLVVAYLTYEYGVKVWNNKENLLEENKANVKYQDIKDIEEIKENDETQPLLEHTENEEDSTCFLKIRA